MENLETIQSSNAHIFTTEEVLQNQVKNLIHELMDAGNDSHKRGWAMSDIVAEVSESYGRSMASFAKQYIINMCMNEKTPHDGEVTQL